MNNHSLRNGIIKRGVNRHTEHVALVRDAENPAHLFDVVCKSNNDRIVARMVVESLALYREDLAWEERGHDGQIVYIMSWTRQ